MSEKESMKQNCNKGFSIRESIRFKKSYSRSFQTGLLTYVDHLSCVLTRETFYPPIKTGDKLELLFQWGDFKRSIFSHVTKVYDKKYELKFFLPLQKDRRTIEIYIEYLEKRKYEQRQVFERLIKEVL